MVNMAPIVSLVSSILTSSIPGSIHIWRSEYVKMGRGNGE